MNFACNLPVNKVSFGQCSINILLEFYKLGLQPSIFPIGPVDYSGFHTLPDEFKAWLEANINKANKSYRRSTPVFKLWHLQESLQSYGEKQVLLTFHECDEITPIEDNIIKNNNRVLVTSKYTKGIFESLGASNIDAVPLGFDSTSFRILDKKFHPASIVQFGLVGKLEFRKKHLEVLKAWTKKYGNNREYVLNCAVFNPFIKPEDQERIIFQALDGKRYWNVNFNPFMDRNDAYNDFLNSNDVVIGMSSGEGWGLPEFQSVALGKHAVILNATGYKEWATPENAVLVNPSGKAPMADGLFFHKGHDYNQGSGFTWTEEDFGTALETAVQRVKSSKVNTEGLKLQEWTWDKTADSILRALESI